MASLILSGLNESCLEIDSFKLLNAHSFVATVTVKSDWYRASTAFESSIERLGEFLVDLNMVLADANGRANFINEHGNFDLDIELSPRGSVVIRGTVCKSMVDDLQLTYGLQTDHYSLSQFAEQLTQLIQVR